MAAAVPEKKKIGCALILQAFQKKLWIVFEKFRILEIFVLPEKPGKGIFVGSSESRRKIILWLGKKAALLFDVAVAGLGWLPILPVHISSHIFMNGLILLRQVVIIFVIREKVIQGVLKDGDQ